MPEIQVFRLYLKNIDHIAAAEGNNGLGLSKEILLTIDSAIPFPIIFELSHAGKRKAIAAYKRPSEADTTKWVVSEYFGTDWEAEDNPRQALPQALNLNSLYEALLRPLLPTTKKADEPNEAKK